MSVEPPLMRDVLNGVLNSRVDASGLFSAFPYTQMSAGEFAYLIANGVVPVANYSYPPGHLWRYLTSAQIADVVARTLTMDTRGGWQIAVDVAQLAPGGEVYAPAGAYLINRVAGADAQFNGVVIKYVNVFGYSGTGIIVHGDGQSTTLFAGDSSMTIMRWSDSNGRLDNLAFDYNSKGSVTGVSFIGSNTASTTLAEHIDWNTISRISINGCAEGLVFETPSAGSCYYNRIQSYRLYNNTRHVWLRDNATNRGPNRNNFMAGSMLGGNVGFFIDGADTTQLIGVTFENISTGVTPLATPTAIYINSVGTLSGANTENTQIIGCMTEACTRDLDCSNRRTSIIGGTIGNVASTSTSGYPDIWLGGDHVETLRELAIGDPSAADSLLFDNRITAYGSPRIATSANAAGAFPFDNDGTIVIQGREQVASGIQLAVGASSAQGLDVLGTGAVKIRSGSCMVGRIGTAAYSASITLDVSTGNLFEIVASNGVAFTINAPTNPSTGQRITLVIFNTSGGALGAATFNAIFKLSAWTQPANGNNRAITFYYGGTAWREINRTTVDVPN